jgi:hypothetical protein
MNVEVVHDDVIHFKIRHSLSDIHYSKNGILPRFMYRSRARSRHTLQNSIFVNRYSTLKKRNFTPFRVSIKI